MEEIADYVMKHLYQHIFTFTMDSVVEYNLQVKMERMLELGPEEFGIPDDCEKPEMKFAWKAAIRELQRIPDAMTPRQKLMHVGKAIEIVQHSFSLYRQGS